MNTAATDILLQDLWQVCDQHAESWRCWDGEIVIYDHRSGDTMKLDIIMSEIFRFMLQRPVTGSAITDHLAATFELAADQRLRHITDRALHRLREAALIQPLSSPSTPRFG
jgi:PqqD family protein of HPr-rel-A system